MQTDRRPPPLNPPSNYKGIQADTVVKSPTDAQMEAEMDKVLSQTNAQEDKTDKQSVSDDLKKMETEVNAGSYYKEAGAGKAAESKHGERATAGVVAIGSPKNVPSPTSSHRDKLKVDGILPNKRGLARSNSRTASRRNLLPDENEICQQPPLKLLADEDPGPPRVKLLLRKLRLCAVPQEVLLAAAGLKNNINKNQKETLTSALSRKHDALLDIVQSTRSPQGKAMLAPIMVAREVIRVIEVNLFRVLPSILDDSWRINNGGSSLDHDTCEAVTVNTLETRDNTFVDPEWEELRNFYTLAHHFVCAPFNKATLNLFRERGFSNKLLCHLMHPSIDERERDFCKVVLHRLYSVAPTLRPAIRNSMQNSLLEFVFENSTGSISRCTLPPCGPTGVREVLEVLTCITQGFCLPIKERHVHFLTHVLLPLHLPRQNIFQWYFTDLYYCLATYVKKDGCLAAAVVQYLLRHWPHTDSKKQAMMIEEVAQLISLVCEDESAVTKVLKHFLGIVKVCLRCGNAKMVELACNKFWDNEKIITGIWHCHCDKALRELWDSLQALHEQALCWDPSIRMVAVSILKLFQDFAPATYAQLMKQGKQEKNVEEKLLLISVTGGTIDENTL